MESSTAELRIEGEKCKFSIRYGNDKIVENDKINQYSARSILMSHNRKKGEN